MFDKCVVFTDLHLGLKSDSDIHNNDCKEYIEWMIQKAHKFGAETAIFCGDFHHNRSVLNIRTLEYSVEILEKLSKSFNKVYMILGNHDVFFRNSIKTHSLRFGNHITNIKIIDELTIADNCAMIPWIIGDEYKKIKDIQADYIFCHLELPNFFMNSKVIMPKTDHCVLTSDDINGAKYIISGHFHKRQSQKNKKGCEIIYLGSCFPHNYADVDDNERGCLLIENGFPPMYENWNDCPKYKIEKLSTIIDNPDGYLCSKTHIKVEVDLDLSFLELSFMKDTLKHTYGVREFVLVQKQDDSVEMSNSTEEKKYNTVDEIVSGYINNLDSSTYNKSVLLNIYNGL